VTLERFDVKADKLCPFAKGMPKRSSIPKIVIVNQLDYISALNLARDEEIAFAKNIIRASLAA